MFLTILIGTLSACGSTDDSRNAARLPGNFEVAVDGPYQLQSGPSLRDENVAGDALAQSFTSNARLTTITLVTFQVSRDAQGDGTSRKLDVRLHSSASGYPGEKIADLGSVTVADGYRGAKTVAVASPPVLAESRDYFIVVAASPGSGTISTQSVVNTPLSNAETKPMFRMVRSSTGRVGEWTDIEPGRNTVMTIVADNALVAVTTTTARATTTNPATSVTNTPTTQAVAGRTDTTTTSVAVTSTTMRSSMTTVDASTGESTTTVGSAAAGQAASPPTTTRGTGSPSGQLAGASVTTTTATVADGTDATVPDTTPISSSDSSVVDTGDTVVTAVSDSTVPGGVPETGDNSSGGALVTPREAYSPADDPETTRDLAATLAAFAALMAAGAAGAFTGSGTSATGPTRARLSTLATKKLKATGTSRAGAGDAGRLWRRRGTDTVDRLFARLPERIGPYSAVGSRILVDGSWARAIVGSASLVLWPIAAVVGVAWGLDVGGSLGLPTGWVFVLALVLGVVDSLAGGIVALTTTVMVLVAGGIDDWSSVRTLLGIWVVLLSPPLIGNVIRPLRRVVHDVETGLRERIFDYVMAPVGVAFAIEAMTKALNGLSGTVVADSGDLSLVKITVWCAMVARLAAEDAAVHFFPERSRAVQPAKIPGQTKTWGVASAAVRFGVYLFVSEPFFGVRTSTVIAGLLLVVPFAMKPWEDDLPNNESLWRWLPRGFLRFAILVFFGGWLGVVLLGDSPTADTVRAMTPWLFVPSAFFGIAEYFGRAGAPWPDSRIKRWGGAALWVAVVLVLAGVIEIF